MSKIPIFTDSRSSQLPDIVNFQGAAIYWFTSDTLSSLNVLYTLSSIRVQFIRLTSLVHPIAALYPVTLFRPPQGVCVLLNIIGKLTKVNDFLQAVGDTTKNVHIKIVPIGLDNCTSSEDGKSSLVKKTIYLICCRSTTVNYDLLSDYRGIVVSSMPLRLTFLDMRYALGTSTAAQKLPKLISVG